MSQLTNEPGFRVLPSSTFQCKSLRRFQRPLPIIYILVGSYTSGFSYVVHDAHYGFPGSCGFIDKTLFTRIDRTCHTFRAIVIGYRKNIKEISNLSDERNAPRL